MSAQGRVTLQARETERMTVGTTGTQLWTRRQTGLLGFPRVPRNVISPRLRKYPTAKAGSGAPCSRYLSKIVLSLEERNGGTQQPFSLFSLCFVILKGELPCGPSAGQGCTPRMGPPSGVTFTRRLVGTEFAQHHLHEVLSI